MIWREKIEQYIQEGRPVSGGKGDQTLNTEEQSQAAFSQMLQSTFQKQFAGQSDILNNLTQSLTKQLTNPSGFTPQQMTTLQTQNTEGAAKDFAAAQQATNNAVAARGGSALPSGVNAQLTAQNANAGVAEKASGDQNIQLANAQQQQQNYQFAVNALSGVAQAENPNQYASSATGAASTVGDLGAAYKNSQSSQLLAALGGIAGGAATTAGKALGGAV